MTIGGIKPGDMVFVEKKQGWKFLAEVEKVEEKTLHLRPVQSHVSFRTATAREIKKHYKLMGRKNG